MKWLNNINIRAKLTIISLPLSIVVIFSAIFLAVQINNTEAEVTKVYYDTLYTVNSNLVNADRDYYQALVASMQYYDFKNGFTAAPPEFAVTMLEGNMKDFEENKAQVYEKVAKANEVAKKDDTLYVMSKNENGDTIETLYKAFQTKIQEWENSYNLEANTGDWEAWHNKFSETRETIDSMQEITESWAEAAHASLVASNKSKVLIICIIYGVIIVILAITTVLMMRQIRKGLQSITGDLDELAKGDLTKQYPSDNDIGRDDIGRITKSAKMLTQKLAEVMTTSKNMSRELTDTSAELAESSSQATQASGQVTLAVEEISKGAVSQADSVENAVSNTEKIGSDIDVISDAVSAMDKDAEEMIEACNNSMASLDNLIRQNEEVTVFVKEIGGAINSTNTSAKSISQFTEAITDIASRTNLLSLNASIEAARAGEAGKGFAVVADEIRQLADQSNESAGEIRAIVEQLLADASSSVSVLEKLNKSFAIQEEQLNSTRQNMQIMSGNVESVKGTSLDISNRVSGLGDAKESLSGIIADLAALSEENAASTEETNASMEELNATFTLISESADRLRHLAEDLAQAISYFEVELQDVAMQ